MIVASKSGDATTVSMLGRFIVVEQLVLWRLEGLTSVFVMAEALEPTGDAALSLGAFHNTVCLYWLSFFCNIKFLLIVLCFQNGNS